MCDVVSMNSSHNYKLGIYAVFTFGKKEINFLISKTGGFMLLECKIKFISIL